MTPALWIELATFMATMVLGCFGLIRYINSEDSTVIRDTDKMIGRAYTRIDEVKKYMDDEFVREKQCKIMHDNTAFNLAGVEKRMNDRLDKHDEKLEKILEIVMGLKK